MNTTVILNSMHEQNPVRERQVPGTLTHDKTITPAGDLDKTEQESSSSSVTFTDPSTLQSLYPDPTRHIPGNSSTAGLQRLQKPVVTPPQSIRKRVQSLYFYSFGIIIFSAISICTLLAVHTAFQEGSRPISLEIVGYPVALIPLIDSILLFTATSDRVVRATLSVNLLAYLAMTIECYILIIFNFVNFFTGIGAVCLVHMFFLYWTWQNLREVNDLPQQS
jgi:hypothetical protein